MQYRESVWESVLTVIGTRKQSRGHRPRTRQGTRIARFEVLEDRAMLSVSSAFDSVTGTLTIAGDTGGGDIVLASAQSAGSNYVKINGADVGGGLLASNVTSIAISDAPNNDWIDLRGVHPSDFGVLNTVSLTTTGDRAIYGSDLLGRVQGGLYDTVVNLDFPTNLQPLDPALVTWEANPAVVPASENAGAVITQGDSILKADKVRNTFAALGYDGRGVKVGVISGGVGHWANVAATGDLPASITINPSLPGNGDDEGTAMLEIVHDVAPGASLYFSGGAASAADMVSSINWMISQGVKVIVDDLAFFDQPFFQDGAVANAAASAVSSGVTYIAAAGNFAQAHFQGMFASGGTDARYGQMALFATGVTKDPIVVPAQSTTRIFLQWSDPFGGSANDYNLYLVDQNGNPIGPNGGLKSTNLQSGTQNPTEEMDISNNATVPFVAYILIGKSTSAAARNLELFADGGAAFQYVLPTDALIGQQAVSSVVSVAAAGQATPSTIETFSSQGGSTIYSNFGTQTATVRQSLDGTSIDMVQTEAGQFGFFQNPFRGTSAAAPHAAAIAALLLNINPSLTPAQVSNALTSMAVDIGAAGYDNAAGYGRFDAYAAVASILPPKVTDVIISSTTANTYGSNPPYDFGGNVGSEVQLKTVPVGNANRIQVQFSEDVNVAQNDLQLIALNYYEPIPSVASFVPDHTTFTATWTYTTPLLGAQYLLRLRDSVTDLAGNALDGEWTNPGSIITHVSTSVFPSGDRVAGGEFKFILTILPGDTDRSLIVNVIDYNLLLPNYNNGTGKSWTDGDFNGNGAVNVIDYNLLLPYYNLNWQTLTILGDYNGDFKLTSVDSSQFTTYFTAGDDLADINRDGVVNSNDQSLFNALMAAIDSNLHVVG